MPRIVLINVDLPEPFAPNNPVKLPRRRSRLTSGKTTRRSYPTATCSRPLPVSCARCAVRTTRSSYSATSSLLKTDVEPEIGGLRD